jgi:hypothetical protein
MSKYDNAGLAMIPSGYKASKVYSVIPNTADGDFDFSRASTATRVNKDGLIETASSNVPRLDYPLIEGVVQDCPALLLELQRTNLVHYSEDFSNAYWSKSISDSTPVPIVTPNYAISPDGTQNAERVQLTLPTNNEFAVVRRSGINPNATVGSTIYQSIYLKATDISQVGKKVDVYIYDTTNSSYRRIFNHVLTNDWERIESNNLISFGLTSTSVEYVFGKARANATGQDGTTGTITSEAATDFLVWGAQLEQGSYPTSYIPTSGSTVTRAAEICNGAGTSDTFNASEGVLFVEMAALGREKSLFELISLSDGTTTNRMYLGFASGTNKLIWLYGANVFTGETTSIETTNNNKIAFKFKDNDFAIWVNGVEIDSQLSGSTFSSNTFNTMGFDSGSGSSTTRLYANLKQLMTFNKALTDSELEDLTSWDSFLEMAQGQLYKTY